VGRRPRKTPWLIWKAEDSGVATPEDEVGPAWIHDDDGSRSGLAGPVLDGRWITRGEARAIAEEHGLAFIEDEERLPGGDLWLGSGLDVAEINRKLRATGVPEADLRLEESGFGDIKVRGDASWDASSLASGLQSRARPAGLRREFSPARPPGLGGGHCALDLVDAVAHEPCGGSPVQGHKG
jgi:hypothetical protein